MPRKTVTRRDFIKSGMAGTACLSMPGIVSAGAAPAQRPNILWITSEDNGPFLGCYGDAYATTTNLDRLAGESIVYDNAFANTPVCAPARFTILTGMYACAMGTENMRSRYEVPDFVKPYPYYLRSAGYHCTNPGKTDYNFATKDKSHWDKGTYRDRKPGQPFFHVVNITVTHESSIHKRKPIGTHDPGKVALPPYHPDTPEIRRDWAQYYDRIEEMDARVGEILDRLEEDGLAEDTIVFYYSDHGGVLCRSKRFLYDTGTRVPMIVRFPRKYRHLAPGDPSTRTDRIVSFVDLAPTLLSLAGVTVPYHMQGEAFLGPQQKSPREYAYLYRSRMDERFDFMRAVRGKRFKYIRNFMPHRIHGQYLEYLWRAAATRSWEEEYRQGRCNEAQSIFWQTKAPEELYDVASDPWEVNNLAGDPEYEKTLKRMRKQVMGRTRDINDPGFIPEGELIDRCAGTTAYELVRRKDFPAERIIETAEMASMGDARNLPELITRMNDDESSVRLWAATGCAVLGDRAKPAVAALKKRLEDDSGDVRVAAAEALCALDECDIVIPVLVDQLSSDNEMIALRAANVLHVIGRKAASALPAMEAVLKSTSSKYIKRALDKAVEDLRNESSK